MEQRKSYTNTRTHSLTKTPSMGCLMHKIFHHIPCTSAHKWNDIYDIYVYMSLNVGAVCCCWCAKPNHMRCAEKSLYTFSIVTFYQIFWLFDSRYLSNNNNKKHSIHHHIYRHWWDMSSYLSSSSSPSASASFYLPVIFLFNLNELCVSVCCWLGVFKSIYFIFDLFGINWTQF